jgi:hypothetical protein
MKTKLDSPLSRVLAGAALAAALAAAVFFAPKNERVCRGASQQITILAFSSVSDIELSKREAPQIAAQAAQRAAESCGSLTVGIVTNRPEAQLVLHSIKLQPERFAAPNRKPYIRPMLVNAERFLHKNLLVPLGTTSATPGSPFYGSLVKLGEEDQAEQRRPGMVVLIGDLISVERTPSGAPVDFRADSGQGPVEQFIPLLAPLRGSCIVALGTGRESHLPGRRIRYAEAKMKAVLARAGSSFASTTSAELPPGCRRGN